MLRQTAHGAKASAVRGYELGDLDAGVDVLEEDRTDVSATDGVIDVLDDLDVVPLTHRGYSSRRR
jgi:hypothetical protein